MPGFHKKRVLILGARGMLGHDLMEILPREYDVFGADIEELDITDAERVKDYIHGVRPFAVINGAAITDVDGCENDPERAYAVNARGAGNVAEACACSGAFLIHFSTDYVFDGMKGDAYTEEEKPEPLGIYGKSKHAGETAVMEILQDSLIVRTSWLFGSHGKNFVETILSAAATQEILEVVGDQFGCPTYTRDCAGAVAKLITCEYRGVLHVVNSGWTSWYDYACAILHVAGVEGVVVNQLSSEELDRRAPRPPFSVLDNSRYAALTATPMRPWEEALEAYIRERSR